jgi:hypothetical protein
MNVDDVPNGVQTISNYGMFFLNLSSTTCCVRRALCMCLGELAFLHRLCAFTVDPAHPMVLMQNSPIMFGCTELSSDGGDNSSMAGAASCPRACL